MPVGGLVARVFEQLADIGMQSTVVALERQDIVTTPFDNLPGDLALAIERIGCHDRTPQ